MFGADKSGIVDVEIASYILSPELRGQSSQFGPQEGNLDSAGGMKHETEN